MAFETVFLNGSSGGSGSPGLQVCDSFLSDGIQNIFTTSESPIGKITVYINGLILRDTVGYLVLGSQVTLIDQPEINDEITITYFK